MTGKGIHLGIGVGPFFLSLGWSWNDPDRAASFFDLRSGPQDQGSDLTGDHGCFFDHCATDPGVSQMMRASCAADTSFSRGSPDVSFNFDANALGSSVVIARVFCGVFVTVGTAASGSTAVNGTTIFYDHAPFDGS